MRRVRFPASRRFHHRFANFSHVFFSKKSLAAVGFGIMPWMTWMVISPLLGVNHVNAGIGLMMVG